MVDRVIDGGTMATARRLFVLGALAAALLSVSACGGSAPTPPPAPISPPAPTLTPAPTSAPATALLPTLSSSPLAVFDIATEADDMPGAQADSTLVDILVSWHPASTGGASDLRLVVSPDGGTPTQIAPVSAGTKSPAMHMPLSASPEVGWTSFEVPSAYRSGTLVETSPDGTSSQISVEW